jgi:hypothetical protein
LKFNPILCSINQQNPRKPAHWRKILGARATGTSWTHGPALPFNGEIGAGVSASIFVALLSWGLSMEKKNPDRRQVVKQVGVVVGGIATMLVLPSKWTAPVMNSIIGPAHGETLTELQRSQFVSLLNSSANASLSKAVSALSSSSSSR